MCPVGMCTGHDTDTQKPTRAHHNPRHVCVPGSVLCCAAFMSAQQAIFKDIVDLTKKYASQCHDPPANAWPGERRALPGKIDLPSYYTATIFKN